MLKKNILIRPANRKKRINFCKEKRDWTIEDWKNVVFSDEAMVAIGNDRKIHIWRRSAPYLICSEDRNRIAVMFWGCVSSRGVGALIPVSGTIDSVKYIEILENYLRPSIFGIRLLFFSKIMPHAILQGSFGSTWQKMMFSH